MNKNLTLLISSLSEDDFRKLILEYLKEKYKTPSVRITDGPYDGGNDLEVIIKDRDIKRNIQVTVQKQGFEKKLDDDLQKASQNILKYNYVNNLDFYISQSLTKAKRNELEHNAEVKYGINLKIVDANILSQEAADYTSIREFTYSAHELKPENSRQKIVDKQTKILFDVLTLNKNSVEIKKNFINSYIFSYLYAYPNSSSEQIFEYLNPHLNETLDGDFLKKELNYLRSKKKIESLSDKNRYQLTKVQKEEIEGIYSVVSEQEEELENTINSFITEHNLPFTSSELLERLYKLYRENYTIDIDEIKSTNNSYNTSVKRTFSDLTNFFNKKCLPKEKAETYSRELIELCKSNDYLNKLSSIHLFNNLYSSNKLEKYINSKEQRVFLDTQVLIRMLCTLYNDKIDYPDIAMQASKILLRTLENYRSKIKLYSSYDYVNEVVGHLLEAYKLKRFLDLSFVSKLGKSKNVFYNCFVELLKQGVLDGETQFLDFIESILGIDIGDVTYEEFSQIAKKRIIEIFEQIEVELIYHPNYSNFSSIKVAYEKSLAYQAKERSISATENDLRTILFLSQKENNIDVQNGEINEPFLITWDSAFYAFRKDLLKSHQELCYWYIYTPLKLVDRLSIMNFNLNPESISLNIIALTETNFNYSAKTGSFIDVISSFFNTEDVGKLGIINKLASLKDNTREINEIPDSEITDTEKESEVITNLLLDIKSYYNSNEAKHKFEDVINVFENKQLEESILRILEESIKNYNKLIMFESFDKLIEEK